MKVLAFIEHPPDCRILLRKLDEEGDLSPCETSTGKKGNNIVLVLKEEKDTAVAVTWTRGEEGGNFWIRVTGTKETTEERGIKIKGASIILPQKVTAEARALAREMDVEESFAQIFLDEKKRLNLGQEISLRVSLVLDPSDLRDKILLGYLVLDCEGKLELRGDKKTARIPLLLALAQAYKRQDKRIIEYLAEKGLEEAELVLEGQEEAAFLRLKRQVELWKGLRAVRQQQEGRKAQETS